MPSYNHCTFMGHLTRSPELRYTPNGTPVATIGIASNRKFKQGEELKEEVTFIDAVAFGRTAETIGQYVDKGDCILIAGRIQQRRWETDDGQKRSKHEIVIERLQFVKTKKGAGNGQTSGGAGQEDHPEYAHDNPY